MLRCCNGLGRCVFLRIFLRISGKSWVYRHLSPILGKCSLCYIPCLLSGTLRKHCTSAPPCVFPNFSFIFCTAFWSSVVIHSDSHIRLTLCERKEELKHSWKQRRTKEPLDESERGEWKTWLKTQRWKNEDYSIWSHHFMANRWGNNGNSDRLYFWGGSKITTDGDCSHEIKRHLLLGRKVMNHLDSILKSRDITLPTKVRLVKAIVFPVVMYGCKSWTTKKAEHQRIDGFGCGVGEDSWESLG